MLIHAHYRAPKIKLQYLQLAPGADHVLLPGQEAARFLGESIMRPVTSAGGGSPGCIPPSPQRARIQVRCARVRAGKGSEAEQGCCQGRAEEGRMSSVSSRWRREGRGGHRGPEPQLGLLTEQVDLTDPTHPQHHHHPTGSLDCISYGATAKQGGD